MLAATSPPRPTGSVRPPPRCTATLADAFGSDQLPPEAHRDLAGQMLSRLDVALAEVPELAPHAKARAAAFADLAAIDEPLRSSASTATTTWAR